MIWVRREYLNLLFLSTPSIAYIWLAHSTLGFCFFCSPRFGQQQLSLEGETYIYWTSPVTSTQIILLKSYEKKHAHVVQPSTTIQIVGVEFGLHMRTDE